MLSVTDRRWYKLTGRCIWDGNLELEGKWGTWYGNWGLVLWITDQKEITQKRI